MRRPIDDTLERMSSDHVRVVNLSLRIKIDSSAPLKKDVQGYSRSSQTQKELDKANDATGRER